MEIILQEDFPSLGYVGDRVQVRPGYARNFLIPRGIAVEAFSRNARLLGHKLAGINAKKAKLKAQADEVARRLEPVELEFTLKLGAQGKSFGSITVSDVESALREKGFAIDRKQLRIPEAIRKPGSYKVQVKLHAEVIVPVTVKVNAEAEKKAAPAEGGEKKPEKKKRERKAAAGEEDTAKPAEE